VVVEPGHGDRDLETFYRLLMNTGAKKHIPVREVNYFKELYWTLAKTGMGQLFMAKKDGGAIAAGMSSRFGRMASLLYLSNDYTIKYTGWAVQRVPHIHRKKPTRDTGSISSKRASAPISSVGTGTPIISSNRHSTPAFERLSGACR
jgi:hypothetical protein